MTESQSVQADGKLCYNREKLLSLRNCEEANSGPPANILRKDLDIIMRSTKVKRPVAGGRSSSMNTADHFLPEYANDNRGNYGGRMGSSNRVHGSSTSSRGPRMQQNNVMIIESKPRMEAKPLSTTENAWKPMFVSNQKVEEKETVLKKLRGILNKLCPEKFDKLKVDFATLVANNSVLLNDIIKVVIDKAVLEKHFSMEYARVCRHCIESLGTNKLETDPNTTVGEQFKKTLLHECNVLFHKTLSDELSIPVANTKNAKNKKKNQAKASELQTAVEKAKQADKDRRQKMEDEIKQTTDVAKKEELQHEYETMLNMDIKKNVGLIKFYGNLYDVKLLTNTMMMRVFVLLIKEIQKPEQAEVLCELFITISKALYQDSDKNEQSEIKECVRKMKRHADVEKDKRIKFAIQNATDYFDNNFVAKHRSQKQVGPSTKKEVLNKMQEEEATISNALNNASSNHQQGGRQNDRFNRRGDRGSGGLHSKSTDSWNNIMKSASENKRTFKTLNTQATDEVSLTPCTGNSSAFKVWGRGSSGGNNSGNRSNAKTSTSSAPTANMRNKFSMLEDDDDEMPSLRPQFKSFSNNRPQQIPSRSAAAAGPAYTQPKAPEPVAAPVVEMPATVTYEDNEVLERKFLGDYTEYYNNGKEKATTELISEYKKYERECFVLYMLNIMGEQKNVQAAVKGVIKLIIHLSQAAVLDATMILRALDAHIERYVDDLSFDIPNLLKDLPLLMSQLIKSKIVDSDKVVECVNKSQFNRDVLLMHLVKCLGQDDKIEALRFWAKNCKPATDLTGLKKLDAVHDKLKDLGLGFINYLPEDVKTGDAVAEHLNSRKINWDDKMDVRDLVLAMLFPHMKKEEANMLDQAGIVFLGMSKCDGMTAAARLNVVFALQHFCAIGVTQTTPDVELMRSLLDEACEQGLVGKSTLSDWVESNSDELYLGTFVTALKNFIREIQ